MSLPNRKEIRIWWMCSSLQMTLTDVWTLTWRRDPGSRCFGWSKTVVDICFPHNYCTVYQQLWEAPLFFGHLGIWFRVLLAQLPLFTSSSIHTASDKHLSGRARSSWKNHQAPFAHPCLASRSYQHKKFLLILLLISIQSTTNVTPATSSYATLEQK